MNAPVSREDESPVVSARDRMRQKRWRLLGTVVLVGGLLAAAVIYERAPAPDGQAEYLVDSGTKLSGNYKRFENEMKQIGGESNVIAAEFSDWFSALWHGRRLAGTVGVLSLAASLGCFLVAHLLNFPPPPDPKSRAEPHGRLS